MALQAIVTMAQGEREQAAEALTGMLEAAAGTDQLVSVVDDGVRKPERGRRPV